MSHLILNVDDNEAARYGTSRVLRRAGYEVIEAGTAAAALRLNAEHKPTLVILDVNLPDASGYEVCRQLKSTPAPSALVLQSSATHLDNEARVQGLNAGADGYLIQPADPDVLLATVRSLLRIADAEAALRAAGDKLSSILESITDLFISFDQDLRIVDINERAAMTLFGKGRAQLLGQPLIDEEQNQTRLPPLQPELRRALQEGVPVHFETATTSPPPWFEAHAYPSGQQISVYLRDISERKQAAKEIEDLLAREQAAREQAEAASHAKDEFLATVSHELRSPINAILLWTNVLTSSSSLREEAVARALTGIERSARLQARLIDDLLDISRIVAGKLRIDRVEVPLASAIEAALENVRSEAEAKTLTLETKLDDEPAIVYGDPGRLQQIFANILSNAVKFSSPGERVTITLRNEADSAVVQVIDRGQGISPAFLPHVFDPFRQADSSTTRSHTGLGLGLAIVRNLVLIHGGEVAAESAGEGHGATFTVQLPRRHGATVAESTDIKRDRSQLLVGYRLLLVDDDAEFRTALATQLRGWGAAVTTASSAREAFDLFEQVRPDVVLSDIGMPNDDGYALIRWIRALPPERGGNVKAAAITAYAMPHERSPVLEAGFQVHLSKPIEAEHLLASLRQLIKLRDFERR